MNKLKTSILIFLLSSCSLFAQFKSAEIGIDGLTCSACSRTVEMSIRKLDFVQDVQMNLEHTQGKITFKPNAKVDIGKIAKAVVNAGFSVRYLNANFDFKNVNVSNGYCYAFENASYQFVKTGTKTLNGETTLKFLGKEFLSKKEFKNWEPELKPICTQSANKILFVTI